MQRPALDQILRRAQASDDGALHALVDAYSPRVFGLLLRLTGSHEVAEDLVQETFLRLVRRIREYEDRGRFEAWLFRIAANLARDHVRRGRRRGVPVSLDGVSGDGVADPPAELADRRHGAPDEALDRGEQGRTLERALGRLSEADREILLLRHYSELSFREIAELLGVPLGTALARAHRALQRLREHIAAAEESTTSEGGPDLRPADCGRPEATRGS